MIQGNYTKAVANLVGGGTMTICTKLIWVSNGRDGAASPGWTICGKPAQPAELDDMPRCDEHKLEWIPIEKQP